MQQDNSGRGLLFDPGFWLTGVCFCWVGWISVVQLAGLELELKQWHFVATVLLILLVLAHLSWQLLVRGGLPELEFAGGSLVLLFALLQWQLYVLGGAGHYAVAEDAWIADWTIFTLMHAVRAVDVLDVLEDLHVRTNPLKVEYRSAWSGLILVALHLAVNLFVAGLLIRTATKWAARWTGVGGKRWHPHAVRFACAVGGIACLAAIVWTARGQQWRPIDWLLWPLDNALRTLDVGDAFQVFHWRIHQVPVSLWNGALAIWFRLLVGVAVAVVARRMWLRACGTTGLNVADLVEVLSGDDKNAAKMARQRLVALGSHAVPGIIEEWDDASEPCLGPVLKSIGRPAVIPIVYELPIPNKERFDKDGQPRPAVQVRTKALQWLGDDGIWEAIELLGHKDDVLAHRAEFALQCLAHQARMIEPKEFEVNGTREFSFDLGQTTRAAVEGLRDPNSSELPLAVAMLKANVSDDKRIKDSMDGAIIPLIDMLDHKDERIRALALSTLQSTGDNPREELQELISRWRHGSPPIRNAAGNVLCHAASWSIAKFDLENSPNEGQVEEAIEKLLPPPPSPDNNEGPPDLSPADPSS